MAELEHLNTLIDKIYNFSPEDDTLVAGDMTASGSYFDKEDLATTLMDWVQ